MRRSPKIRPHAKGIAAAALSALLLGACAVGPTWRGPPPVDTGSGWTLPTADAQASVDLASWWTSLHDPVLDRLVEVALSGNLDLRQAQARIREARALRDRAGGGYAPVVDAGGSVTRRRQSENGPLPIGSIPGLQRDQTIYDAGFDASWEIDLFGGTLTYSAGVEVPLTVTLAPPPGFPGNAEFLCTNVQGQLSQAGATLLLMPDDLVPALLWGAIADLLDSSLQANDTMRAAYARSRFEQHIELASIYPSILAARVAEVDTYVDAVETLDSYMPQWEVTNSDPSIVATAGQNLVAFPNIDLNYITVLMVANAPLPTAPTDPVPVGAEVLDVVIDYAAHAASFKMGGAEFEATMPLFKSIIELAGHRNAEIRALSTFRDVLYGRTHRDQQFALLERDLGKVSS